MKDKVLLLLNALGYECVLSRDKLHSGSQVVVMVYGDRYLGFVEVTKKDKIMWSGVKNFTGKPVHVLRLRDLPEALENA